MIRLRGRIDSLPRSHCMPAGCVHAPTADARHAGGRQRAAPHRRRPRPAAPRRRARPSRPPPRRNPARTRRPPADQRRCSLEQLAALPADADARRQVEGRRQLRPDRAGAAHERRARQGRSGGGVLARLPALLRARALRAELAEDQAGIHRVRARARHVGPGASRARAACTTRCEALEPRRPVREGVRHHPPAAQPMLVSVADSDDETLKLQQAIAVKPTASAPRTSPRPTTRSR